MKKTCTLLFAVILFITVTTNAQINFGSVSIENWIGTGSHEAMFVVDFDSDAFGTDSTFAWGIRFDTDSISGDSILSSISQADNNFTYDMAGGFLNNINYFSNSINYTNPNSGWFSILESTDGLTWNWNNGISDKVANQEWFGIVAMNTVSYEAEINVPLTTSTHKLSIESSVKVFPNPAKDYLFINTSDNAEIRILSVEGQELYYEQGNMGRIDISDYDSGIYIVVVSLFNERSFHKVIIE